MKSPSDRTAAPAGFRRNAWLASIGTGGWFTSESVAGFVGIRSLGIGSLVFVLAHSVLWAVALNTHAGFRGVSQTLRMVGRN
jgi:hypothetical protein